MAGPKVFCFSIKRGERCELTCVNQDVTTTFTTIQSSVGFLGETLQFIKRLLGKDSWLFVWRHSFN